MKFRNRFFSVIIVFVVLIVFSMNACNKNNSNSSGSPASSVPITRGSSNILDGTWAGRNDVGYGIQYIISGSDYTFQMFNKEWENHHKGTFSLNAAKTKMTIYPTHLWNGAFWEEWTATWESDVVISENSFALTYEDYTVTYTKQ